MSRKIRELLLTLGIHSTHRGFHFLLYALLLCLQDEDYLLFIGKKLYPAVAEHFGIDFHILDAQDAFAREVMQPFADAYLQGQTPNPCVRCNATIKLDCSGKKRSA